MDSSADQVTFRSTAFPAQPGEDEQINPGRFGLGLATWVRAELIARGVPAAEPIPEDWGWMVAVGGPDVRVFVGCGNVDDDEANVDGDPFVCFVEQARRGLRRRTTPEGDAVVAAAVAALDEALRTHPHVADVRWDDDARH